MTTKARIGFIGVGLMGHGIAKNIVEKGYPLTVLGHRNRQPVEDLLKRGASEADSPADLARRSDIIFLCVTGSPQVEDNVFGRNGLLEGMAAGKIVADCSTAEPTSTLKVGGGDRRARRPLRRHAARAHAQGGRGRPPGRHDRRRCRHARGAAAGAQDVRRGHRPCRTARCRPQAEAVNNFLVLANAAAVAEAIVAARKSGVDLKAFTEIATSGGADSVILRRFAKYYLEGDDSMAKFTIANSAKDLRYYTHMAEATPTVAFLGEAVHQLYTLADIQGFGDKYLPR